jgi:hypothetical protein
MGLRGARRLLYASLPRLLTLRCIPGETVVGASFAENRLHLAWERWATEQLIHQTLLRHP